MRSVLRFSMLNTFAVTLLASISLASVACSRGDRADGLNETTAEQELRTPGKAATDARTPELGNDLRVLANSKTSMAEAIEDAESKHGTIIEAKFELDHSGALALSLYPIGEDLSHDAERNVFQELAGDPTRLPFTGAVEAFTDQEHLTRSARDLTLVQLSRITLLDAVDRYSDEGEVFWAIPTIRHGRAGYGVYTANGKKQKYHFVDGQGSTRRTTRHLVELGTGPGAEATDTRVPKLGSDLQVLRSSRRTMGDALASLEPVHGPAIEAKFELDHSGKLSLSVYPVKDIALDAERSTFGELAGDPTAATFSPSYEEFKVPDVEHLTRSARDLTLVQTAGLSLRDAVYAAECAVPGGFVYWAIPTIRDTRAGYGVYVYGTDKKAHYFFVS